MTLSKKQLAALHLAQSTVIAGAVIALYVLHRIPLDTTAAVLGVQGGFWSAVGGALKLSGGSNAAVPLDVASPGASAPPAAVSPNANPTPAMNTLPPIAPPPGEGNPALISGPTLGPEHGAPT